MTEIRDRAKRLERNSTQPFLPFQTTSQQTLKWTEPHRNAAVGLLRQMLLGAVSAERNTKGTNTKETGNE